MRKHVCCNTSHAQASVACFSLRKLGSSFMDLDQYGLLGKSFTATLGKMVQSLQACSSDLPTGLEQDHCPASNPHVCPRRPHAPRVDGQQEHRCTTRGYFYLLHNLTVQVIILQAKETSTGQQSCDYGCHLIGPLVVLNSLVGANKTNSTRGLNSCLHPSSCCWALRAT